MVPPGGQEGASPLRGGGAGGTRQVPLFHAVQCRVAPSVGAGGAFGGVHAVVAVEVRWVAGEGGGCARLSQQTGALVAAEGVLPPQPPLPSHEPLQLVHTRVLVVVDPPHSVEGTDGPHVLRQSLGLRPLEVVDDGDDVALVLERAHDLLVHPVLAGLVFDAAVQRVFCEHEDEVTRLADGRQQVVVELASLQPLHVDEGGEAS